MFLENSTKIHFDAKFKNFSKMRNWVLLKTPFMYERNYENKLGGNISILCEALAPYDALATAPCVVCQCGSAISYKSGLNFTIVN
jgi:hypothetical protein